MVPTTHFVRALGRILLFVFVMTPFLLLLVPWQQSVNASGRVIAFDPTERQQTIEAPVDGRISKIYVRENSRVKQGDKLLSIQDQNPNLVGLLESQKLAIMDRKKAASERRETFRIQTDALMTSRKAAERAATERVEMALRRYDASKQSVEVARLSRDVASENYKMEDKLRPEGLNSRLTWLQAKQVMESRDVEFERSKVTRDASFQEIDALKADREKAINDAESSLLVATANWQSAMSEMAIAERDYADLEIRLGRQASQEVNSSCDGIVFRVLANSASGGAVVKVGDPLLIIVPDIPETTDRVVELFMDGNDAPLVTELWRSHLRDQAIREAEQRGLPADSDEVNTIFRELLNQRQQTDIKVRLQFEGWPAIQWVGWPSVAVGTFAGIIAFVDPHDDGKGSFRILVRPDPDEEKTNPWPSGYSLRQGLRAQGWVQLNQVSLGWELWRRLNGFPPIVAPKNPEKETKATKVKVPK